MSLLMWIPDFGLLSVMDHTSGMLMGIWSCSSLSTPHDSIIIFPSLTPPEPCGRSQLQEPVQLQTHSANCREQAQLKGAGMIFFSGVFMQNLFEIA